MGAFYVNTVWLIQDLLVLIAALVTVFFIVRKETHPESILMEMVCFCILNAAVYENFATIVGFYGYGRSLFMIGNVPISVPVMEYLVVYAALRMLSHMHIPTWCKPFIVGFCGMVFDFTLDPLSIKLLSGEAGSVLARWTWFPKPTDAQIFGEPVYNFTGWVMICGIAAAFILLGRWWHGKTKNNRFVGYVYPVLGMIAALLVLVLPSTNFMLWLEPIFQKGSVGEWIMLAFWLAAPVVLLAVFWRGRMREKLVLRDNLPIVLVFVAFPVFHLLFTLVCGIFEIAWLVALFAALMILLIVSVRFSRRVTPG
jgi:hypothetical protein